MSHDDGKKRGNLSVTDGGQAGSPRRSADLELERASRALFYAMRAKDGTSINKNFRNIARGHTHPLRQIVRRFKEAKAARNAANYPLMKRTIRELDKYVDALHGKTPDQITGEHKPAA